MSTNVKISSPDGGYKEINVVMPNGGSQKIVRQDGGNNVTVSSRVTSGEVNDKHYTFNQTVSTNTWSITHNLGKYPSVSVVDSADRVVIGQVDYIDNNSLTITFKSAFKGKAYLN